jgi:hypothetical protein
MVEWLIWLLALEFDDHRASHAGSGGGGCGHSSAMRRKISWNFPRIVEPISAPPHAAITSVDEALLFIRCASVAKLDSLGGPASLYRSRAESRR